ncbi:hypothetical protein [Arthrobacter sp. MYb213]|uniref:hypothetical protein n=1 Tax=Arthrobacter sp. MYb213 TaxID=1848595 RepID=UPI000D456D2A|nr:hypothetical protein [Arthrobacter sp. MYb213]PRB71625.1 hypothetical protein CQ011_07005 [Arthrobacter sp. MYb213]
MDIDSTSGSMIVQFPDTQPLMLGGTGGLYATVAAVWALRGRQGLEGHPGLAYLRSLEQGQTIRLWIGIWSGWVQITGAATAD